MGRRNSACTSLWQCAVGYGLFVFNFIDMVFGVVLIVYSSHLGVNHYAPQWLYEPLLCLGIFLIMAVFISWWGTSNDEWNCCLRFSSWLFAFLAVFELILSLLIIANANALTDFLEKHQAEMKISDAQLEKLEKHKFIPVYLMMSLFLMENIRFWCSGGLISIRKKQAKINYMQLTNASPIDTDSHDLEKDLATKYAVLKDNYAAKYQDEMT